MKITVVTGPFISIPPGPAGAKERVWFDVSRAFAASGHEVELFTSAHPKVAGGVVDGVQINTVKSLKSSGNIYVDILKDSVYALKVMRRIRKDSDVVVTNTFWLPVFLSRLSRLPRKVYVHIARAPKGQIWLYRKADRISTVSSAMEKFLIADDPKAEGRIKVVPNPIATDLFVPPKSERDFTQEKVVTFTGRVHPEKGLELLINGFRELMTRRPDCQMKLNIVGAHQVEGGGGGEQYFSKLQSLAEGLNVQFHPKVNDRKELASLLQKTHYHCYPSLALKGEAFGVAPLEAMGCGCITIVSALPQFRDFMTDGETGIVFDHEASDAPQKLADAFERALDLGQDGSVELSKKASALAATFTVERIANEYLSDFEELLSS